MTGPSSERTADADVALVRDYIDLLEYGHPNGWDERRYDALAALDRLVAQTEVLRDKLEAWEESEDSSPSWEQVDSANQRFVDLSAKHQALVARNQQLQEALAYIENRLTTVEGDYVIKSYAAAIDARERARAALASVPTEATEFCRRCRDTQEALERLTKAMEEIRQTADADQDEALMDFAAAALMSAKERP